MNTPIIAFHGKQELKFVYVDRVEAHRLADQIIQGHGWDGSKGCMIGCLAHHYPAHAVLERDIGLPEMVGRLADTIHEELPSPDYKAWPGRVVEAMRTGADLSRVGWGFLHWLLTDETVNPGISHPPVKDAVAEVAKLIGVLKSGGKIDAEAARIAALNVSWSADSATGAPGRAARSAEWSAWSAECRAKSAPSGPGAGSAMRRAAGFGNASYKVMADKLIEIIGDAPDVFPAPQTEGAE